ncbi:MAG TPA: signal peptidase I [Candidatus Dorea intestinavium]|nr:signal peptidase I [Candidatus Dorea intestinavium]
MENLQRDDEDDKNEMKNSPARELLGWLMYIGIIILLTWFIVTFIGVRTKVSGRSMETTLQDGNQLIVDKISYRFKDPKRYDIVVFPYKYEANTHYIKRIIGLPGETVQVKDGYTYINNELLESDIYGAELMDSPGIAETPITLGKDEYFVLGDNRNHSADSREPNVGIINRKDLTGRAWIRIYPFSKFGVIKHE